MPALCTHIEFKTHKRTQKLCTFLHSHARSHTYASAGEHTVTITGQLWGFRCTHAHAEILPSGLISVFTFSFFILSPHTASVMLATRPKSKR
jgi:hypothetical protein